MIRLFILLIVGITCCSSLAAAQYKVIGETEMEWPGIHYQIFWLARLAPDRLVVGVRMQATAQAPPNTLVGYPVPIPANATEDEIKSGKFRTLPFSLASSTMVDDATQQKYPTLSNISPPGRVYLPSEGVGNLAAGKAYCFTVEFQIPPPPPPAPGQPPVKQTLSFFFTKAKGAIMHIPLPPPGP